jgi:hypothetical protein
VPEILDLTAEPEQAAVPPGLAAVTVQPYDPSRAREHIRGALAILLTAVLCAIACVAIVAGMFFDDWSGRKEAFELVFTPLVGLVGAVTGFYYGEKAR